MLTAGKQVKTSAFVSNKKIFKKLEKINSCFLKKKTVKNFVSFQKNIKFKKLKQFEEKEEVYVKGSSMGF